MATQLLTPLGLISWGQTSTRAGARSGAARCASFHGCARGQRSTWTCRPSRAHSYSCAPPGLRTKSSRRGAAATRSSVGSARRDRRRRRARRREGWRCRQEKVVSVQKGENGKHTTTTKPDATDARQNTSLRCCTEGVSVALHGHTRGTVRKRTRHAHSFTHRSTPHSHQPALCSTLDALTATS